VRFAVRARAASWAFLRTHSAATVVIAVVTVTAVTTALTIGTKAGYSDLAFTSS
jgi:hypothetical protein